MYVCMHIYIQTHTYTFKFLYVLRSSQWRQSRLEGARGLGLASGPHVDVGYISGPERGYHIMPLGSL